MLTLREGAHRKPWRFPKNRITGDSRCRGIGRQCFSCNGIGICGGSVGRGIVSGIIRTAAQAQQSRRGDNRRQQRRQCHRTSEFTFCHFHTAEILNIRLQRRPLNVIASALRNRQRQRKSNRNPAEASSERLLARRECSLSYMRPISHRPTSPKNHFVL